MALGVAFWILMLLWLIFGLYWGYSGGGHLVIGGNLIVFFLFLLLGWKVFGSPLHG
jgi:hypothetical protein